MDLTGPSTDFEIYHRHLPHWRADHVIYFVTWRIVAGVPPLSDVERSFVASALEFFDNRRYWLLAYVVMDDHVHVLVRIAPEHSLENVVHSWKSFTANRFQKETGRVGSVWQQEPYDRVVRDRFELGNALQYIAYNPTKRWPDSKEYPWVKILINSEG